MAYDSAKPANDGYLSAFPPEMREQLRALIEDQIVDALKLMGLSPGNAAGNIPVSNGAVNTNLNADKLDGSDATAFAAAGHGHSAATQSTNGFMSNTDKTKLDGVASGAEANQNAFSNVVVGSTTIQADGKTDTLELAAGANISLIPDAANDRVTIALTGKVPSAATADSSTFAISAGTAGTCTGNAASASYAPFLICPDGDRNPNTKTPILNPNGMRLDFVIAGAVGTGGNFAGLMTFAPWVGTSASAGECSYQLVFGSTQANGGNPMLRLRNGIDSTWNSFIDLITSANIAGQSVASAVSVTGPVSGSQISALRTNTATDLGTARELRWRYYGNGHTIIDNSLGEYGANIRDAANPWSSTFPTLMGFNGASTYGVRVDSARVADSAPAQAGSVIQVVSAIKTDTFALSGVNSYTDITGLSASITPSSAANKILARFTISAHGNNNSFFQLVRGATPIGIGTSVSTRVAATASIGNISNGKTATAAGEVLDAPASTSAITYKVQTRSESSGYVYINRNNDDSDNSTYPRTVSTLTLMEVKG